MKRRSFLQLLGVTATAPLMGKEVYKLAEVPTPPIPVKPVEPVKAVKAMPSQFLNKQIHFKNIGTFGVDDHFTISERRDVMEYHSLAEKEPHILPMDRGADMDVRIYANTKQMKMFKHHFETFGKLEVSFEMDGLLVSAEDVVISSISTVLNMNDPLALDLTLELQTEKITMKEV